MEVCVVADRGIGSLTHVPLLVGLGAGWNCRGVRQAHAQLVLARAAVTKSHSLVTSQ